MTDKKEKFLAAFMMGLLLLSLLPIMYLGKYNHPTGDDYHYGVHARLAWESSGNLMNIITVAAKGVLYEYKQWQGTYSAMFFMYLPPNVFGDHAYRFVTPVILLLLTGSIFYLLKHLLCDRLNTSTSFWFIASAGISLLCIETVPTQGETFFWYNGSMYYTCYFSVMLFFLGFLFRYLSGEVKRTWHMPILLITAFFLAGGNYVSLLPCLIFLFLEAVWLFFQKSPKAWGVCMTAMTMLTGFLISAAAPGNRIRQRDMWKIPAWKAILKSLLQGIRYITAWTGCWLLLLVLLLTPLLLKYLKKCDFGFRYPLATVGLMYGLFCSMSCPTFYTMNSTGPARVVSIVYYGYILFFCSAYCYLLGYVQKTWGGRIKTLFAMPKIRSLFATAMLSLFVLQIFLGNLQPLTTAKALRLLISKEAQAYDVEYRQRLEVLSDPAVQDVLLAPFKTPPTCFMSATFPAVIRKAPLIRVWLPISIKNPLLFRLLKKSYPPLDTLSL